MKKQKTSTNKGFSMIELIIVIAIMAILIAVLAPVYTRYLERARISDDTTLADHLKTAVETSLVDPVVTPNPAEGDYVIGTPTGTEVALTTSAFWDNVAGIMSSTYANGAAMQSGLLSKCRATGVAKIKITIKGDVAEVYVLDASGNALVTVK